MENSQHSEIKKSPSSKQLPRVAKISDIRQSREWAEYLESFGWKSFRGPGDINIEVMKMPLGSAVKIQRAGVVDSTDLAGIERICRARKALFVKIEPNLMQDLSIFDERGYVKSRATLSPPSTIYIDLGLPEKNLMSQISKSGRYSIRRAVRDGNKVEFFKKPSSEQLALLHNLMQLSAGRNKFRTVSLADLESKNQIWGENAFLAFSYNSSGDLCGAKYFLARGDCVWYMHDGTSSVGRTNESGHLLMWECFRYFKNLNYAWLDLEGVDDPRIAHTVKTWGGFSYFKEKFGGVKAEYPLPRVLYFNKLFGFFAGKSFLGF